MILQFLTFLNGIINYLTHEKISNLSGSFMAGIVMCPN